jgi:hypothetical protein
MYIFYQGRVSVLAGEMPDEARAATEAEIAEYIAARDAGPDMTAFVAACAQFRQVCTQIQSFAGLDAFQGGFDEAMAFLQSAAFAADKTEGNYLFTLWVGADKYATYEAGKIGLGQPAWWHDCWETQNNA